ncbi:hypothetical protein [Salmonirosea aquatica]|uniref:Uncharacterized protein n=1 Tax=Salmonirosea aquatica TaxID=2654236 RepID=A0A7C9FQ05_9BACT|nr:hypothetical protein [Cytophagaceae bacterium SJW1-29]
MDTNLQWDYDSSKEPNQPSSLRHQRSVQEVFEVELAEELPVFASIIEAAFNEGLSELARRPPIYQNRISKANKINELTKGMLFERFPDEMKEDSDRFYFVKGGIGCTSKN